MAKVPDTTSDRRPDGPLVEIEQALPAESRHRMEAGAGPFTSDLSVNEFILTRQAGFRPCGLVLGTSIYRLGITSRMKVGSQEMVSMSQAMYSARELAMTRMEAEADLAGADGVVGVRLDVQLHAWGKHVIEFLAVGTALKADVPGAWRTAAGMPFTSDLSGQDFWALLQAGYAPLGLVMGTCVYHVGSSLAQGSVGTTVELKTYTDAFYRARELAMQRMSDDAAHLGADGVVGVNIIESNQVWGTHVVEFLAIGTAVRELPGVKPIAPPQLVIPVSR